MVSNLSDSPAPPPPGLLKAVAVALFSEWLFKATTLLQANRQAGCPHVCLSLPFWSTPQTIRRRAHVPIGGGRLPQSGAHKSVSEAFTYIYWKCTVSQSQS